MESFRKMAYKKAEYQDQAPPAPTPEALAFSEKVAQEKLAKILDPAFDDFSVRYVNLEEYRALLENKEFGGRGEGWGNMEVSGHGKDAKNKETFIEFLPNVKEWMFPYTQWEESTRSTSVARQVLANLQRHVEANHSLSKEEKLTAIREGLLLMLQGKRGIRNYAGLSDGMLEGLASASMQDLFKKMYAHTPSENLEPSLSFLAPEEIAKVRTEAAAMRVWDVGQVTSAEQLAPEHKKALQAYIDSVFMEAQYGESLRVLVQFRDDPHYLHQSGGLRHVVNAFSYVLDNPLRRGDRHYQIALVFDNKTYGLTYEYGERWSSFKKAQMPGSEAEKQRGLLAAISLMPLKEMHKEMIEIEKGLGDFAHPVFDSNGTLRWPMAEYGEGKI